MDRQMFPLNELIKKRESRRIIDPNRMVEKEKIQSLLEAARWAPSCSNNQPWRFVVSLSDSLDRVKECLSRGNSWARNAPLIFTVASKADLDCQIAGRDYYPLGLGLAIENLLLQGIHMGLTIHPIAGFKEKLVKEVLNIPEEYRIFALIIAGYPGSPDDVDERVFEKEKSPRERKPLSETVFWEGWGLQPVK
jgi:nitroreductase